MRMNRILVPLDLSHCATNVAGEAASLASMTGAKVLLLHAVKVPDGISADAKIDPTGDGEPMRLVDYLVGEAEPMMSPYVRICDDQRVDHRVEVVTGDAVEQILAHATSWRADLIVMGTHARKGFSRVFLGSVSEEVIRLADMPVMTIRSRHNDLCGEESCSWCSSGVTSGQLQGWSEVDG